MSKFLWLELDYYHGRVLEVPTLYRRLDRRLREAGHEVGAIVTDESNVVRGSVEEQVSSADVLLLGRSFIFGDDSTNLRGASPQQAIRDAIDGKSRLLVFAERFCREPETNRVAIDFLKTSFGIDPRPLKLYPPKYPPCWELSIKDQPNLQHFPFVSGIDRILVDRPSQLAYTRDAFPLLVVDSTAEPMIQDDLVIAGDIGPRSVAVGWPASDNVDARVLAFSGTILPVSSDPDHYLSPNDQFIDQLMYWLATAAPGPGWRSRPMNIIEPIETRLNDLVVDVLRRRFGPDQWWEQGVPQRIKLRAEGHDGFNPLAPELSLTLVQYSDIIKHNWALFEPIFDPDGSQGKRSLSWIDELNIIRRRAAHTVRLRSEPITNVEWAFLDRVNNDLDRLTTARGLQVLEKLSPPVEFGVDERSASREDLLRTIEQGYVVARARGMFTSELSNMYYQWCKGHQRVFVRAELDEDVGMLLVDPQTAAPLSDDQVLALGDLLSNYTDRKNVHVSNRYSYATGIQWSVIGELALRVGAMVQGEGGD